jgi:aryl-alcohol dehydrogenase-like predicted oxidoreductase
LAKALGLADVRGLNRFVAMQNHYSLVYREEEREMIPLCREEGIAIVPWSPLARGLLAGTRKRADDAESTTRAATDQFARNLYDHPHDWDVVEATRQVASRRGVSPAQVALAWLLSKPDVTAPIIGATKLDHLTAAVGAVGFALSEDEVAALEAPYLPHAVRGFDY